MARSVDSVYSKERYFRGDWAYTKRGDHLCGRLKQRVGAMECQPRGRALCQQLHSAESDLARQCLLRHWTGCAVQVHQGRDRWQSRLGSRFEQEFLCVCHLRYRRGAA